jgi:predicted metal-dependent hydrolase
MWRVAELCLWKTVFLKYFRACAQWQNDGVDQIGFDRGAALFNRAEFFEAHEVWEDVWRASPPEQKKFVQGLIQISVALHHYSTNNLAGAQSLLRRGTRNLADCPREFGGIDMDALLDEIHSWQRALETNGAVPVAPRLRSVGR